jgi:hypothetical protein
VIKSSQDLYLNIRQHKHRINTCAHQTTMPWVGFEPTIQAFEQAKTVRVLDRAATVIGTVLIPKYNYNDQVNEDKMGRACSTH